MRIVAALGGNALLRRGETPDADIQEHHVERAAKALAPVARDHELIITHGNGPQVGVLAQESARDPDLSRPYPFDVLGAQTQGMIGYWLVQALGSVLPGRHPVSLLTRTVVGPDDSAFSKPTKFIGPLYDFERSRELAAARGWRMAKDGAAWRRVVASPRPVRIVELPMISSLVRAGALVVCCGGGGVPVVETAHGFKGVEAVVDKDYAAARLGVDLLADRLLLLTDVHAVVKGFGTPEAVPLGRIGVGDLDPQQFPAGSMGPKIEAACDFVKAGRGSAAIGSLDEAAEVLEGRRGTTITLD